MKKIIIKNNSGTIIGENELEDSKVQEFLDKLKINSPYGKPEHQVEDVPGCINEDGTITPSTYKTIPAEYTVEQIDITQEVEAERVKKETKKSDRVSRVSQLKALDFNTITTIAQLKAVVRLLVKESLYDDE